MTDTVRDIRQQPFYWIERDFLPAYGKQLGPHAIAVYNALVFRSDRSGRAFPGLSDLSELTGIKAKNTIRKALDTLVKFGIIRMNQRYNGLNYDSNEYYILPICGSPDEPGVVHQMNQGGSPDEPGVVHQMNQGGSPDEPGVVHQMNQGGSPDDTYLHTLNNNQFNNNQLTTASSMHAPLAAAAESLLLENAVDVQKINGQGTDLAAWIVYARTQPGLKNPVGYAMTRIKRNEQPADVFREIVALDIDWPELLRYARYEQLYRENPGTQGLELYEDLETVSDEAITILNELREARS